MKRINQHQLNEELLWDARTGEVADVHKTILEGADPKYEDEAGLNALDYAVLSDRADIAEYLLERILKKDQKAAGKALILAQTPAMVKLLSRYNPDCNFENHGGLKPIEVMVRHRNYDLMATYIELGLPLPSPNAKVLRWIIDQMDLTAWGCYTGMEVPETCREKLEEIKKLHHYNVKKQKAEFNNLLVEVSRYSQTGEGSVPGGNR